MNTEERQIIKILSLMLPEVKPGDDLTRFIINAAKDSGIDIRDGDVIVVTSKILLKARGLLFKIEGVKPSLASRIISRITGKDAREVELTLSASRDILAVVSLRDVRRELLSRITMDIDAAYEVMSKIPSLLVVVTRQGLVALDGGVDYSNLPDGYAISNIIDFDEEARKLRDEIMEITGKRVAIVISDTETNISGKLGSVDVAIGSSGIKPVTPYFASKDIYGRGKFGGVDIIVDEIASAAALLMGQTSERIPVVMVRGLKYLESDEGVGDYVMGINKIPLNMMVKTFLVKLVYRLLYKRKRRLNQVKI